MDSESTVKIVIFFKRKRGMSVEGFQRHWRTNHASIVVKLPGLKRYKQSHVLASAYRDGEPLYDAVAESYFESTQAMRDLARTPAYAAVLADEPNFIDGPTMKSIITDEIVLKDAPLSVGSIKSIDFLRRREGMSVDQFQEYWRETHGPMRRASSAMRRYVQSHTRRTGYNDGRTPAYDGVSMAWFDSADALQAAAAAPASAAIEADLDNFVTCDRTPSLLTTELIILA